MSATQGEVKLGIDQLKELLAEMRKPVVTEEDRRQFEAKLQERREGAENEKERQANLRRQIEMCDHMKAFPWNGQTAAVYVKGCGDPGSGNFFLCQHCQARIHPDQPIPGHSYDSIRDVFDTNEFNRLWRMSQVAGMIG